MLHKLLNVLTPNISHLTPSGNVEAFATAAVSLSAFFTVFNLSSPHPDMSMSGTLMGASQCTGVQRMPIPRSRLGRQLGMEGVEGELGLEEIGRTTEVVNVFTSSTEGDINLSNYLSRGDLPIEFTSMERWKNTCLEHYERLMEQTTTMGTDYLVFCKVTTVDLVKIDKSRCDLSIRIFYDTSLELLIVKFMVGKAHDLVGNLFGDLLQEKVERRCGERRALYHMGAFRCTSVLDCKKEPDVALVPKNRNHLKDWPSIVIEVGVSESLAALRNDVHFWILHSRGLTWVVMLIAVDIVSKMIAIEVWGNEPPVYPSHVVGPIIQPRMVQRVTIDTNGAVGAPLDVPSGLIFDVGNVPRGVLLTDFSFDASELVAFHEEF